MWQRVGTGALLLFLASACSSDDGDDGDGDDGREWKCFEGSAGCWCVEVELGDEAGSSDPEVERCSYTNCVSYREGSTRHCRCAPAEVVPASYWEDPMPVAACPLD